MGGWRTKARLLAGRAARGNPCEGVPPRHRAQDKDPGAAGAALAAPQREGGRLIRPLACLDGPATADGEIAGCGSRATIGSRERADGARGPGMASEIADQESFEDWLRTRPREVAVGMAARAALRVLPLQLRLSQLETRPRQFVELTATSFRATALARVAAKYPTRANELRAAAYAAAAAASSAASAYDAAAADAAAAASAAAVRPASAAAPPPTPPTTPPPPPPPPPYAAPPPPTPTPFGSNSRKTPTGRVGWASERSCPRRSGLSANRNGRRRPGPP